LRELGYVEGQNIAIEYRWADGNYDRLPGLTTELLRLKVSIIVSYGAAMQSAQRATGSIPIVGAVMQDPVGTGLVVSLAHPGRNITGLSSMASELAGKQLEILKEAIPKISQVAVLANPDNANNAEQLRLAKDAAPRAGVRPEALMARNAAEIDGAFAAITAKGSVAVIILPDSVLLDQRARIAELAARRRLPTVALLVDHAQAGALIAYGPSIPDAFRRAATYVDKILKGAKPGDLPVEQPTKFELTINLRTAKALGLTIPPALLARADQVIQ